MNSNHIQLVPLAPHLVTAYDIRNRHRDQGGRPLSRGSLKRVEKSNAKAWRASRGTAEALEVLDQLVKDAGGPGLTLLRAWRDQNRQGELHRALISGKSTAYYAPPGESNHGWGGAFDQDVHALYFEVGGTLYAGNDALSIFWEMAYSVGFSPAIVYPNIHQPEAWHFNHWGPLKEVVFRYLAAAREDKKYSDARGLAAAVGCSLAGAYPGARALERMVQARLLVAGFWCGLPDGIIGSKTRGAVLEATGFIVKASMPASEVLAALDEELIGLREVWSA